MSKKIKSTKNKFFFGVIWFTFLCLVSILLAIYVIGGVNDMLAVGRDTNIEISIEIPKDTSLDEISRILKENEIIKDRTVFKLYARLVKIKRFANGTFDLNTSMDYQAILNTIKDKEEASEIVKVLFAESMNILEYAKILEEKEICSKKVFLKTCDSDEFDGKFTVLRDIPNTKDRIYKLEGYLFPDTYEFYKGTDASAVINKMLNNCQKKLTVRREIPGTSSKMTIKERAKEKDISLDKLLIIASLIQAEAADKEDMRYVASVIFNRLSTVPKKSNKFGEFDLGVLRIDATVYYPYRNKAAVPKDLLDNFKGTYNTYDFEGLPQGPICNPGLDAIFAVLNPAETDYFYYCHSKEGKAFYAKTNKEQINNLHKAGLK